MALSSLTLPPLPRQAVAVPALGGEVIVQGLLLSQRLALHALRADLATPQPGENEPQAAARAGAAIVPRMLAMSVVDPEGKPLWSADQWEQFGAVHPGPALDLFDHAMRLSGAARPPDDPGN